MTAVTPTDRPKSVRNSCVIKVLVAFYVTLLFGLFCGCRGFCHRTESDLFLFLFPTTYILPNLWLLLFRRISVICLMSVIPLASFCNISRLLFLSFVRVLVVLRAIVAIKLNLS